MTKGKLITKLKKMGVHRNPDGKKLEHLKSYDVIKLYYDTIGE